jgi:predicted enzyme related to lactoylglutathione lyase
LSLHRSPLLYVFLETRQLTRQRKLLESLIGLPVVEIEPHLPHERHGVVKYDAGNLIMSLNLAGSSRFSRDGSDALVTVLTVDPTWHIDEQLRNSTDLATAHGRGLSTDMHGHHFLLRSAPADSTSHRRWPAVEELRLSVADLSVSVPFYRDVLGLDLLGLDENTAHFDTGTVRLVLERARVAADGRCLRRSTYLLVFYSKDIEETRATLMQRGLVFKSQRVGIGEIGGTIRFEDPSGHRFCLYEPSVESLTWGSGEKVMEIVADRVTTN